MDSDGSDGGDSGDHSPPEMPGTGTRFGRSMDAPFLITALVASLLFAAFIFYFTR